MFHRMPYFMTNPEWYIDTHNGWSCELTDKAPQEAVKSFNEWKANRISDEDIDEAVAALERRLKKRLELENDV